MKAVTEYRSKMRISKYALKHLHSYPSVKLPDWLTTSTRAKPVAADYDPEETDSSGRQYPLPEPVTYRCSREGNFWVATGVEGFFHD